MITQRVRSDGPVPAELLEGGEVVVGITIRFENYYPI